MTAHQKVSEGGGYLEEDQSVIRLVFDDLDGFIAARVLMTAIEIDLFPLLKDTKLGPAAIVDQLGLDRQNGMTFLHICNRLGYLANTGESYSLTARSNVVLKNYDRFKAYVENRTFIYQDLLGLASLVKTGNNKTVSIDTWPFKKNDVDPSSLSVGQISFYSQYMDASIRFWAKMFLDAVDLSDCSALLDVGGGTGSMGLEVAKRHPHLQVGVFDLASVGKLAEANLNNSGLHGRVRFYPGDFLNHPFPSKFDVMTLMRVCLDWQDREVSQLLSKIHASLPPGGRALIAEAMYTGDEDDDRERAKNETRCLLIGGKVRSPEEISELLANAGFQYISTLHTSISVFKIVQGTKV